MDPFSFGPADSVPDSPLFSRLSFHQPQTPPARFYSSQLDFEIDESDNDRMRKQERVCPQGTGRRQLQQTYYDQQASGSWNQERSRRQNSSSSSANHRSVLKSPPHQAQQNPGRPGAPGYNSGYGSSGSSSSPQQSRAPVNRPYSPSQQEAKIRITRLPKGSWTQDVYAELHKYGYIVKIDMVPGVRDSIAYVVFQPPPSPALFNQTITVNRFPVNIEPLNMRIFTVPSPVNPSRLYKELNVLHANRIDFGVRVAPTSMITMQTVTAPNKVHVALNLRRKEIDIKFPLEIDGVLQMYWFRLPISQLSRIHMITDHSGGQCSLIIPFESPPQFFRLAKGEELAKTFNPSDRIWNEFNAWYRMTDLVNNKTRAYIEHTPLKHPKDSVVVDIGRWTTYRVFFDVSSIKGPLFEEFRSALADHGVQITTEIQYNFQDRAAAPLWTLLQEEMSATHPHLEPSGSQSTFDDLFSDQVNLGFPVHYQLEVCLSNGYIKEHNITREFLERLASMDAAQALYILEKVAGKQDVYYDPMEIFSIPVKAEPVKNIPSYCVLTRAVIITPTMIHVATPVVETSNRIIRKYAAEADRFLRVKFSDEKTEGRIHSQPNGRSDALFDRIGRAMAEGIVVAGRYYEFLAHGNSQFREHGAYFFAPTLSNWADNIRLSMGSFHHIKTIAKLGARIGQNFSTTRAIKSITIDIVRIPDIERNGFTFTDGVGKLSTFLSQMAAQELGLQNAFEDPPSLFQFRLAGCKGVLVLDPNLQGRTVCIRPSQYKFDAVNEGLEIIRASAFATACFNRQLIIVLSTLGVSDHVFIRKQQQMVNDFERATKEESVALQKLQRNIDFNQTTLTMAAMILDGFMERKDPFMMSLLQLWRAFHIKFLKEKARIVIEKGAFVLGCVDETATLRGHFDDPQCRPGATRDEKLATLPEIYLQISDPDKKGFYKVIEGICILARNPSLHAGDLRIVRAVNVPALQHLKNVVVLPQTGDRDLSNMCSGGDLDGDDYLVMWDTDFLPATVNEIPMDFTSEKPVDFDEPITIKHITDFFVTYMQNDSLARIALAHLAQADFNEDGVRDETCIQLAQLHSQAVDYPKSGIPAIMTRDLVPKKYPHFMENKHRPPEKIYKSKKILGMLFDQVELVDFKPQYQNDFDSRVLGAFPLDDDILTKAALLKDSYDSDIRRLMAKHDICTEFEAWSTFALSHNQELRDYTFAEDFGRSIGALKTQHRKACREAAGATSSADFEKLALFVTAMYVVTAREMKTALKECGESQVVGGRQVPVRKMDLENMPLMSFPWLFQYELGKIATGSTADREAVTAKQGKEKAKGHAKHHDFVMEPGMGDIKTKDGVTAYGEMLRLDFDEGTEIVGSPPEKVIKQAATRVESDRTRTPSITDGNGSGSDEHVELSEVEDKEVKIDTSKASAVDRLMRL